jgi:hypothetical protein
VRQPGDRRQRITSDDLSELGCELDQLRRKCRRLRRRADQDWTSWSAAVDETNRLARRISRVTPQTLPDLLVRYEALTWLVIGGDDVIMDAGARAVFIAFGRALRRLTRTAASRR